MSIKVTQADREAAASGAVLSEMRDLIRAGRADHHAEPWAKHRQQAVAAEVAQIVAGLKSENGQCDCFARSEGECGCGAWSDYKTWPLERVWEWIERGEYKETSGE